MPILQIDAETRLAIAQAIRKSVHEACQIIELPDGTRLRVLGFFGHVCFELCTAAGPEQVQLELFGANGCIRGDHNAKVAHCRNYLT